MIKNVMLVIMVLSLVFSAVGCGGNQQVDEVAEFSYQVMRDLVLAELVRQQVDHDTYMRMIPTAGDSQYELEPGQERLWNIAREVAIASKSRLTVLQESYQLLIQTNDERDQALWAIIHFGLMEWEMAETYCLTMLNDDIDMRSNRQFDAIMMHNSSKMLSAHEIMNEQ